MRERGFTVLRQIPSNKTKLEILFVKAGFTPVTWMSLRHRFDRAQQAERELRSIGLITTYNISQPPKYQEAYNISCSCSPAFLAIDRGLHLIDPHASRDNYIHFHWGMGRLNGISQTAIIAYLRGETISDDKLPVGVVHHPLFPPPFFLSAGHWEQEWDDYLQKTARAILLYPRIALGLGLVPKDGFEPSRALRLTGF